MSGLVRNRRSLWLGITAGVLVVVTIIVGGIAYGVLGLLAGGTAGKAAFDAQCAQKTGIVEPVDFTGNKGAHTPEQLQVANIGAGVAFAHKELSPKDRLQLARIVLIIGLVESEWRNLRFGDRTSLGWLQQQEWWGTVAQRTNVAQSTELLISGGAIVPSIPGDGREDGILDLAGWQSMSPGEVAWRVQKPAENLRGKYATRLAEVDNFLKGRQPNALDLGNKDLLGFKPLTTNDELLAACQNLDPALLGQKDGFTFPVAASQAVIKEGVQYDNKRWVWCYTSVTNCHHDYNAADIHAPPGTPVVAAMPGVVVKVVNDVTCSADSTDVPRITIRDANTDTYYYYTHLQPGSVTPKVGQTISPGERIALIGPATCAEGTGPHLHINATKGPMGKTEDPTVRARMIDLQPLLVGAFNLIGRPQLPAGTWVKPANGPITSVFGWRFHPILHYWRLHAGTDYGVSLNDPIVAASSGVVETASYAGGAGNMVKIKHAGEIHSCYEHLNSFATGIKPGANVLAGQVIGYAGTTGLSTGVHLHFCILTGADQKPIDPAKFLVSQRVKP